MQQPKRRKAENVFMNPTFIIRLRFWFWFHILRSGLFLKTGFYSKTHTCMDTQKHPHAL